MAKKKQTKIKPKFNRKTVTISKVVYDQFKLQYKGHRENSGRSDPYIFLLAENGHHIVKDMAKLSTEEGCGEMPYVPSAELTNAYILLASKNLVPCGIARVGRYFSNDGLWDDEGSGNGIYRRLGYILTYDGGEDKLRAVGCSREYFEYYEDFDSNLNEDQQYNKQFKEHFNIYPVNVGK